MKAFDTVYIGSTRAFEIVYTYVESTRAFAILYSVYKGVQQSTYVRSVDQGVCQSGGAAARASAAKAGAPAPRTSRGKAGISPRSSAAKSRQAIALALVAGSLLQTMPDEVSDARKIVRYCEL